jgi:hypothetical protein
MRGLRGCEDQNPLPKAGSRRLTAKGRLDGERRLSDSVPCDVRLMAGRRKAFAHHHHERIVKDMVIFKCPYCQAEYEMTTARLSFRQRSYAKCHVCYRTMYSWTSRNVPVFTFVNAFEEKTSDIQL